MAGPGDLYLLASEWLAVCVAAVTTGPGGPIDRAFVSPGPPAFDCCPQLTVHAGGPAEADTLPLQPPLAPGHRASVQGSVHLVNLTATVIRCVPGIDNNGTLPSVASLAGAAEELNGDLWAIWNHTLGRKRDGTLFASPSGSREMILDPAFALQPAGGCAGWQIQIRVALSGYSA